MEDLAGQALMIAAVTGMCNFVLNLVIAWKAGKIHTRTVELVTQTNSLIDNALDKTEAMARAEGKAEVLASLIVPVDPAATSAEMIDRAAEKLTAVIEKAIAPRKENGV